MPAPSTLPTTIVNGVTTGHNAHAEAIARRFNMGGIPNVYNVVEWGADPTGAVNAAAIINAAYSAAHTAGGGVLYFPPGEYLYNADLEWDSNLVSVLGAGSSSVTLQADVTAKIIARPNPMTITQGPRFAGFTVRGDTGAPAAATGVYSGDITASEWDDIVIEGFNGAGSIGLHLDNDTNWTEVNKFRRIRIDDCTVCLRCSVTTSSSNSFARNMWDIHFNLHADQIGFQTTDDALLYGQKGSFDGNAIGDDAVFVDMLGTSSISGEINMDFEQTTGTGALGLREFNPGFQFFARGVRNYAQTMDEDNAGGVDLLQLPGGLRIKEGLSNSRQGANALVGGTVTVATSAIKDAVEGQRIDLTRQLGGGVRGHLEIGTRTAGVSFVIKSVDSAGSLVADTSVISWRITERY